MPATMILSGAPVNAPAQGAQRMRVVKNILISLGVLFLIFGAFFAWMVVGSHHFRKEQGPFVEVFVTDFSQHWDIADVYDRLENSLAEQFATPDGLQVLGHFKQLGPLKSVHDLELRNYNTGTTGRTGEFLFKGSFENGEAIVNVTIVKKDGAVRVLGIHLIPTELRTGKTKIQA